jgi:hypothetical protein
MYRHLLVPTAVVLLQATAHAAPQPDALVAARECTALTDDARRLACYDAALRATQAPATVAAEPAKAKSPAGADEQAAANGAAREATDRFGYRGEVARRELERQAAATPKADSLQARIVAVEWLPHGQFMLTLDNGQVWRQKTPESIGPLKAGDEVTIRAGSLGSFRLSGSSARSTHVQRVK